MMKTCSSPTRTWSKIPNLFYCCWQIIVSKRLWSFCIVRTPTSLNLKYLWVRPGSLTFGSSSKREGKRAPRVYIVWNSKSKKTKQRMLTWTTKRRKVRQVTKRPMKITNSCAQGSYTLSSNLLSSLAILYKAWSSTIRGNQAVLARI